MALLHVTAGGGVTARQGGFDVELPALDVGPLSDIFGLASDFRRQSEAEVEALRSEVLRRGVDRLRGDSFETVVQSVQRRVVDRRALDEFLAAHGAVYASFLSLTIVRQVGSRPLRGAQTFRGGLAGVV